MVQEYSTIKQSRIEGLEPLAGKFNQMTTTFKKKPYSPLDHRKTEFISDYREFQHQIHDLGESLYTCMISTFKKVSCCMQTLRLLYR